MTIFIKASEAPQTKLRLKKAILNGSIIVFEKDNNWEKNYRKLDNVNSILSLWDGFRYYPKYQGETNEATAYLGTSFYYKFAKA
jgi:hypothetical protein